MINRSMVPTTRAQFVSYILRRLGQGVIKINVSDEQVQDRVDEALKYYADYHYDGSEKVYLKHLVTQDDINNKYLVLPDNILGAVQIFPIGESLTSNNLFNIRYQIALNDLYDLTSVTMVPYYMAMQHIQFLEQLLVGRQPIRYVRTNQRLYLDMDWQRTAPGEFIVVEAYQLIDPNEFPKVWGDRWLARYASELVKRQWGENLSKFQDVSLPGGIKFNGAKIRDDADAEVKRLEAEMLNSFSEPPSWIMM